MKNRLDYEKTQLKNGLTILFCRRPHLPLISINAFLRVGKDQNLPDQPGVASLTARLLDEGTENYSHKVISDVIESVGGELSSFSERELTGICIQMPRSELGQGIELLSEMVSRPIFPVDRLEIEREKVVNHIRAMRDDPQIVGSQILNKWVYKNTPLAEPVLGNAETLRALRADDLKKFHSQTYGAQDSILVIVGDAESEKVHDLIRQHFADWKQYPLEPPRRWQLHRQTECATDRTRLAKEQINVFIGHLGTTRNNSDHYALQVMDTILGGGPGFASRIPRKLRDELGLAYVTYADISGSSGLYPGRFIAFIATSSEHLDRALSGLHSEIDLLLEKGVTQAELKTAQDFLTGNFVFEFQSNASIARFLLFTELFSLPERYLECYPTLIRNVTKERVLEVARKYLDPVNYTTVIVGPV